MTIVQNRDRLATTTARDLALACVEAGIEAADPGRAVRERVALDGDDLVVDGDRYDLGSYDRVVVLGGGKAAGVLAIAVEEVLGDRIDDGLVVTTAPAAGERRASASDPTVPPDLERVAVRTGTHPVPERENVRATRALLERAAATDERDLVLALVTGGGSALLAAPAEGLSLADLRATTEALLAAGATIEEINAVRKHCSAIKGGHLATALAPSTVVGLLVSDVVGDDPAVIASGPLAPDGSTYRDALAVLDRRDVGVPAAVRDHLEAGAAGDRRETPDGGSRFDDVDLHVLASGATAIEGAAAVARERGYRACSLGDRIRGEAREVGRVLGGIGSTVYAAGDPVEPPVVLLSGGETTVTLRGDGTGGPNHEVALAAVLALEDLEGPDSPVVVASVDTDGIDGASDAAGGIATAGTASPVEDARRALERNDAGGFLASRDGTIETGPTGTNVNDLRAIVVPDRS